MRKKKRNLSLNIYSSPFLLAIFYFSQIAATFPWDYVNINNEGIKKYLRKEYSEAELLFRQARLANSNNYQIKYNLAESLYKQGRFTESETIYLDLLKESNLDYLFKQQVLYNLGNIYYRIGEQKKPDVFWLNSLKQYESALNLNPVDKEVSENYDFVKNKLEKLNKHKKNTDKISNKPEQEDIQDSGPKSSSYLNSPAVPQEGRTYSVTKSEAEEILQDLKLQEDSMQKFINRRQVKNNPRKTSDLENSEFKDW